MKYSIIHHPSREINPSIMRELDKVTVYTDFRNEGCTAMHLKALADASATYEPTVIIEDDAILCHGFADLAKYYFDVVLGESDDIDAVSFYAGRGAPVYIQDAYSEVIKETEETAKNYFCLPSLYHAVCYAINPRRYECIEKLKKTSSLPIDELLANKLHKVKYAWPCLADHDDSQPSIVEHEGVRPTVQRVAWGFRG